MGAAGGGPVNVPDSVVLWLANGECGSSSRFMVAHLFGLETRNKSVWRGKEHPLDPSDFRRCQLLLEAVPEASIGQMINASDVWADLVGSWNTIVALLDEEVPTWRDGESRASAPKAYKLMKDLGT